MKKLFLLILALMLLSPACAFAQPYDGSGAFGTGGGSGGGSGDILQTEIDTSAELRNILTDETGTGLSVFNNGPTLTNPLISGATGTLLIPSSTTLPATCSTGQIYMDTDATTGRRIYACQSANTWAVQGDGGGLSDIVNDTSPQLGGALDTNTYGIDINGATAYLTFEGATNDSNETIFYAEDPTGDRTIQLPNIAGGYVALSNFSGSSLPTAGYYAQWQADGTLGQVAEPATGNLSAGATNDDNCVPRYNGTDSLLLQESSVCIDDEDNLSVPGTITASTIILTGNGDFSKTTASYDPFVLIEYTGSTMDIGDYSNSHTVHIEGPGAMTFLGNASFALPNGSAPTVDAVGEVAFDTSDNQIKIYNGSAVKVYTNEKTVCLPIESLAATDDNYAFYMNGDAITVTGVACNCRGTCSTPATFTLEDRAGNAMTITGTSPTCATTGAATFAAVTAGNTLTAGEMAAFDVTNTPTTGDTYAVCLTFTTDAQ